ncbi:hypothetical protein BC828DRAFT_408129 [Blastocladiella britannica]|nr:hypothetical protein BC828DRAFT_408129 [Blastocladiella britannica]
MTLLPPTTPLSALFAGSDLSPRGGGGGGGGGGVPRPLAIDTSPAALYDTGYTPARSTTARTLSIAALAYPVPPATARNGPRRSERVLRPVVIDVPEGIAGRRSSIGLGPTGRDAVIPTRWGGLALFDLKRPYDAPVVLHRAKGPLTASYQPQLDGLAKVAWNPHISRDTLVAGTCLRNGS